MYWHDSGNGVFFPRGGNEIMAHLCRRYNAAFKKNAVGLFVLC